MDSWTFEAIGTRWQIDTAEPLADAVRADVLAEIDRFDRVWSRFRPDSLVTEMSQRPGTWAVPMQDNAMLDLYTQLHDVTEGAVNPLVGGTLADLGYDAGYSLTPKAEPVGVGWWSSVSLSSDLADRPTLTLAEPALLDVGAMGKGLLVDHVGSIVDDHTHQFTIDAGGDILHGGTTQLRVALEHPADPTRVVGVVELDPEDAVCGSAVNRRAWGDGLHHVLDGRTGRPTTDVIATWAVVTQSCMRADALATAHFFAEPEVLMARFDHHYVRVHADGRVRWSPDLPGEVFA